MALKLGKLPATKDVRDLKLAAYVDHSKLPPLPANIGHEDRMPQPRLMLGNGPDDSVAPGFQGAGDCVFAMICNAIRLAHGIAGVPAPFTGKEAIAAYSEVTGYILDDESTDNGTDMRKALNWWRKVGIRDAFGHRHKLAAFAALDPRNLHAELEALYLLDIGVGVGIMFPDTAMDEFDRGMPWSQTGSSNEGHAILWDAKRKLDKVETWARDQAATPHFLAKQVDEAYALFTTEALVRGKSVEGIGVSDLLADVRALEAA